MGVRFYAGQYAAWHHMIDVREFMGHEPLRADGKTLPAYDAEAVRTDVGG